MLLRSKREKRPGRDSGRVTNVSRRRSARAASIPAVLASFVALGLASLWLGACGGDSSPAVAHVGGATISRATVEHWARVLARGGAGEGLRPPSHGSPAQRALGLLISAAWIDGEAAHQGVEPSKDEIGKGLSERKEANGASEFEAALQATGQTVEDVEVEVRAELAAAALARKLADQAARVSETQIVDFYHRNHLLYTTPETRHTELIEHLPSPAAARALVRRIGTGAAFTERALKEAVVRTITGAPSPGDIPEISNAIFASRTGVVSKPLPLNGRWSVFIVRKIVPAKLKPLAVVRRELIRRLVAQRHREIVASFERELRKRWRAKTSCRRGYVVQKCAQYTGPEVAEESVLPSE